MPPRKQDVEMFEERFADRLPGPTTINHRLEISQQMRKAQLTLAERVTVIGLGAITRVLSQSLRTIPYIETFVHEKYH
jgi:hypothetical protein